VDHYPRKGTKAHIYRNILGEHFIQVGDGALIWFNWAEFLKGNGVHALARKMMEDAGFGLEDAYESLIELMPEAREIIERMLARKAFEKILRPSSREFFKEPPF
jgi:hypothetical protein